MLLFAADHAGWELEQGLVKYFTAQNFELLDLTPNLHVGDDYPDVAKIVADNLRVDSNSLAITVCGTGQGVNMVLNRYPYIRSAVTDNVQIAELSRLHNDANVLALAGRFLTLEKAIELVKVFVKTEFSGDERHIRRIGKIS